MVLLATGPLGQPGREAALSDPPPDRVRMDAEELRRLGDRVLTGRLEV
jgi:hypothetical protein